MCRDERRWSAAPVLDGVAEWGPQFDGMYVIPAVICGVLIALVADIGVRTRNAPTVAWSG